MDTQTQTVYLHATKTHSDVSKTRLLPTDSQFL